jgi:hypothetical protein
LALLSVRPVPRFVERASQVEPSPGTGTSIAQRQAALDFGRASVALEGLRVSTEAKALQQQWVRGEISMQECIDAIK